MLASIIEAGKQVVRELSIACLILIQDTLLDTFWAKSDPLIVLRPIIITIFIHLQVY